jgi:diguanylate cyclase (GGDEF)-like protein/PAS domain S-box-containing protein
MAAKNRKVRASATAAVPIEVLAEAPIEAMIEAVVLVDSRGRIVTLNAAAEDLFGWDRASAMGRRHDEVLRLVDAQGRVPDSPVLRCLRDRQMVRIDAWQDCEAMARDGRRLSIRLRCTPALGGAVLAVQDLSQQNLLARELQYRSTHDPVTGLLNRDAIDRRLAEALTQARHGGVKALFCHIDVDQFRIVNESLGNGAGDEFLRELAAHLRARLLPGDAIGRLAADHFGVLLPGCDRRSGAQRVDSLLAAARGLRFGWGRRKHSATCSIGAVEIDRRAGGVAEILALAEATSLAAQTAGRDRAFYAAASDELRRRRKTEMDTVAQLRDALERGLFELHSEDVVSVMNPQQVVYRELLVRMRGADGVLIKPEGFVPVAERYSMVAALDRWIIGAALRELARHRDDGVIHAINLSGMSLSDDHLLGFVEECIARHRIAPHRICFEITETATIARLAEAVRLIVRLRELGCRFALDDFGAGMTSFSYLKTLPVDFLKIDGSFVSGMRQSRVNHGMVAAIHRVGQEMGLKTIAEHVEDRTTLKMLRELGVDYAQGRIIALARPFVGLRRAS